MVTCVSSVVSKPCTRTIQWNGLYVWDCQLRPVTANYHLASKDVLIFMFSWCLEVKLSCSQIDCFKV